MKGLWALWGFAKKYWKGLVAALLLMAISGVISAKAVYMTRHVFEPLFQSFTGLDEAARIARMDLLFHYALVLFCYLVAAAVTTGGAMYMGEWLGQKVLLDLRATVFHHLQMLSMKFFDQRRSGELISRVNNDTTVLQNTLSANLSILVIAPVTTVATTIYMVTLSWRLTLLLAMIGPVVYLVTRYLGHRVRRYSRLTQERVAVLQF